MGEAQKLTPDEQIEARGKSSSPAETSRSPSRRSSRSSTRQTLGLANRFEELQAAAAGTQLERAPRRRADRLRDRGAHGPLRDVRGGCGRHGREARASCSGSRRARGRSRGDGHAPLEPVAGAADHRHAALPPQRRDAALRRLAQQHASACTSTSGSRAPTGPIAVSDALRTYLPRPARATRRARRSWRACSRTFTRPGRRSSRACSRAAGSPTPSATGTSTSAIVRFLYEHGLGDRAHAALVERPPRTWRSRPWRSGSADGQPDLAEARASRRSMFALIARIARAIDEGEPLADHPHRLHRGEPLARDPPRSLRRLSSTSTPARCGPPGQEIEELIEWVLPVADELGVTSYLDRPARQRGGAADRPLRAGGDARGDLREQEAGARAVV